MKKDSDHSTVGVASTTAPSADAVERRFTKREQRYFARIHERADLLRRRLADTQMRHTEEITQELHALDWALMVIAEYQAGSPSSAHASQAASATERVDEGFVLVPVEPTPEMRGAYKNAIRDLIHSTPEHARKWRTKKHGYDIPEDEKLMARWKAMLSASGKGK